jgi:hypothetical protein
MKWQMHGPLTAELGARTLLQHLTLKEVLDIPDFHVNSLKSASASFGAS